MLDKITVAQPELGIAAQKHGKSSKKWMCCGFFFAFFFFGHLSLPSTTVGYVCSVKVRLM